MRGIEAEARRRQRHNDLFRADAALVVRLRRLASDREQPFASRLFGRTHVLFPSPPARLTLERIKLVLRPEFRVRFAAHEPHRFPADGTQWMPEYGIGHTKWFHKNPPDDGGPLPGLSVNERVRHG